MILISHRGNIIGRNPSEENRPRYILEAQKVGYDVEIDIWWYQSAWYLGHDEPQYPINEKFFNQVNRFKTWYHAKNGDAFYKMIKNTQFHCFWHQTDDYVLTSFGYIWTYPSKPFLPDCIAVLPERGYEGDLKVCGGVCSDYIESYKHLQ
jgi:hypothetical protein